MSAAVRSALGAFIVLAVVGMLWPAPVPDKMGDSYGRMGHGQRALFELFSEVGIPVGRSAARASERPEDGTVWSIQPWAWCSRPTAAERDRTEDGDDEREDLPGPERSWLEAGGTAVVFLPAWVPSDTMPWRIEDLGDEPPRCKALSGFALPTRDLGVAARDLDPEPERDELEEPDGKDGEDGVADLADVAERWWRKELDRSPMVGAFASQRLVGPLLAEARDLPTRPLLRFAAAPEEGFEVVASLDGEPFALERAVGKGRLVVLADSGFLLNRWLDVGDAAPFALDLVRAYGAPIFDERIHGHTATPGLLRYLASSAAFPVLLGLTGLGLLVWAHGSALPASDVIEHDPGAPALEPFVDALASLYAGSRDWSRVALRYRSLSFARVRRHFSLSPDVPEARLLERLRREGRVPADRLAWFAPGAVEAVVTHADLQAAITQLDQLVTEVCS